MMIVDFGILIPAFNHANYIESCISSIVRQYEGTLRIHVVDDGSTDDTVAIVQRIAEDPSNRGHDISIEANIRNRGSSRTINEAIESLDWDWIVLCNSDDEFELGRVGKLERSIRSNPLATWGFGPVVFIDSSGQTLEQETSQFRSEMARLTAVWGSIEFALLAKNFTASSGNLFFRKDLWRSIGGFADFSHVHDWDFCLQAMAFDSPLFLDEAGYRYRIHDANTFRRIPARASRLEVETVIRRFAERLRKPHALSCASPRMNPFLWDLYVQFDGGHLRTVC